MIVGVMADSHDHLRLVRKALEVFGVRGAEVVIHAGDVVAPFAARLLAGFDRPVMAVFGNNDGERAGLATAMDISPGPRAIELGGRRIVVAHDLPEMPEGDVAAADVVVTGHTHAPLIERGEGGRPLMLNPGETGGWLTGRATCAVLDTDSLEAELCELGGP